VIDEGPGFVSSDADVSEGVAEEVVDLKEAPGALEVLLLRWDCGYWARRSGLRRRFD
jgi:hypothetical protein